VSKRKFSNRRWSSTRVPNTGKSRQSEGENHANAFNAAGRAFERVVPANEICEENWATEEERARADNDAAFALACRIIIMKSLPAWIDEICAEQL
jgi:hypothetical protein